MYYTLVQLPFVLHHITLLCNILYTFYTVPFYYVRSKIRNLFILKIMQIRYITIARAVVQMEIH